MSLKLHCPLTVVLSQPTPEGIGSLFFEVNKKNMSSRVPGGQAEIQDTFTFDPDGKLSKTGFIWTAKEKQNLRTSLHLALGWHRFPETLYPLSIEASSDIKIIEEVRYTQGAAPSYTICLSSSERSLSAIHKVVCETLPEGVS